MRLGNLDVESWAMCYSPYLIYGFRDSFSAVGTIWGVSVCYSYRRVSTISAYNARGQAGRVEIGPRPVRSPGWRAETSQKHIAAYGGLGLYILGVCDPLVETANGAAECR